MQIGNLSDFLRIHRMNILFSGLCLSKIYDAGNFFAKADLEVKGTRRRLAKYINREDQPWFFKLLSEVVAVFLIASVLYANYTTRDNLLQGQQHGKVSLVNGGMVKKLGRYLINDQIPPPDEENNGNGGNTN